MNEPDDYSTWLNQRRAVKADAMLTDRIIAAIDGASSATSVPAHITRLSRVGPILLWTAASLVFAVRIASLVGNFVFPTESYPEFVIDHRIEEPVHEHRKT